MAHTPRDRRHTGDAQHRPDGRSPAGPRPQPAGRGDTRGPSEHIARGGPRATGGTTRRRTARGGRRAIRAALRRESPSVIAVLADEADFAAMQRYASFPFADHPTYLRQAEGLLRARAVQGRHTTVVLFVPIVYGAFCAEARLDPDQPISRARYAAEAAATGPALPYEGQPLSQLIPQLIDAEEHHATHLCATDALVGLGECADCGEDVASAALDRADHAVQALLRAAGAGSHHLVCSVPAEGASLIAVLHFRAESGSTPTETSAAAKVDRADREVFCTVLAAGLATNRPGGVVLRTTAEDQRDTVRGWALRDHWLRPLTEAEVFDAYCTDPDTGEPLAPESGVDYRAGLTLPHPEDEPR
ncbi:hypothetical protein [Streptomyces zagrosensis]|uniref:Uncharacterized protein n=1 Tax=Streptomyces zagrosensis TaxID=1042984 RepID=A0A7W9Q9V4_9ACTN|nr:hypothetical protein [Streptomyces zagrosensis]MBB5935307.1 hypothetical protein [Streptomyces zagrosensis]